MHTQRARWLMIRTASVASACTWPTHAAPEGFAPQWFLYPSEQHQCAEKHTAHSGAASITCMPGYPGAVLSNFDQKFLHEERASRLSSKFLRVRGHDAPVAMATRTYRRVVTYDTYVYTSCTTSRTPPACQAGRQRIGAAIKASRVVHSCMHCVQPNSTRWHE
jgi:hypothetical protein